MVNQSLQVAALKRARDLAGGVSFLARKLGIGADSLDAMLHGAEEVPTWVFLRAVEFMNDAEAEGMEPPMELPGWAREMLDGDTKH